MIKNVLRACFFSFLFDKVFIFIHRCFVSQKQFIKHSKKNIWKVFDQISPSYDFLNHVLSLGIDSYWRRKMLKYLPTQQEICLLDLATGTAAQLITIIKHAKQVKSALGIDLSEEMIRIGQKKIIDKAYAHQITLLKGDATRIAMEDACIDCITMSFGIRNITHPKKCLEECMRVLKDKGRLLILEFSIPKNHLAKAFYLFYLRHILPNIGGMISKDKKAYQYLSQTIETFPYGQAFCKLLKDQGFVHVKAYPMTFGIATLYVGEKAGCQNEF